jgi:TRAP-type C4-dicarboxylate transport system permease large subunit
MAALIGTLRVCGMLFMIIVGSSTFSQILAYTGATSEMIAWATTFEVSPILLVVSMFLVLIFLGTFMDQASMLMLCVPIFYPIIRALDIDPIWFGMIVLLGLEMGLTTPPFGLILFVMMGVAPKGTTLWQVARAALPFLGCDSVCFVLILFFPQIPLYLPSLMN